MMHLLFVGDGRRDAVTVPRLVERILGARIRESTRPWARLHGAGRGYGRKLRYAFLQARDLNVDGLVATVDRDTDKPRRRLGVLRDARMDEQERGTALPTALGEAVPHGEAWLLDDAVAVREGLTLSPDHAIPSVKKAKNPKAALTKLLWESPRSHHPPRDVLRDIAEAVDPARCKNGKSTGFDAFVRDVQTELKPLTALKRRRT